MSETMSGKQRDVIQLLRNMGPYEGAYGGAISMEDSHLRSADYGPAGYIYEGMEFRDYLTPYDLWLLGESIAHLKDALRKLARENYPRYFVLKEPYIEDPGNPSLVAHWRSWAARSDACAAKASIHDKAIRDLAGYLAGVNLYPFYPKLMSEAESRDVEQSNAEMLSEYRRRLRGGASGYVAARETASLFDVSEDYVRRIVDVRDSIKGAACASEDCENKARAQGLCTRHYQQERKFKKRAG